MYDEKRLEKELEEYQKTFDWRNLEPGRLRDVFEDEERRQEAAREYSRKQEERYERYKKIAEEEEREKKRIRKIKEEEERNRPISNAEFQEYKNSTDTIIKEMSDIISKLQEELKHIKDFHISNLIDKRLEEDEQNRERARLQRERDEARAAEDAIEERRRNALIVNARRCKQICNNEYGFDISCSNCGNVGNCHSLQIKYTEFGKISDWAERYL